MLKYIILFFKILNFRSPLYIWHRAPNSWHCRHKQTKKDKLRTSCPSKVVRIALHPTHDLMGLYPLCSAGQRQSGIVFHERSYNVSDIEHYS
jgi:hypothetical protein